LRRSKHLPFADYRGKDGAKDIADENQLASYDFNKAGPAESGVIAIVPSAPAPVQQSMFIRSLPAPPGLIRSQPAIV